jgi:hypothetical protein
MLTNKQLVSVAEDIENFKKWSQCAIELHHVTIRQGSALLRRLLVEDAAGKAWRQIGFSKSLSLGGPSSST